MKNERKEEDKEENNNMGNTKMGEEKKGCENGRNRNENKERKFGKKMTVMGVKWKGIRKKYMKV